MPMIDAYAAAGTFADKHQLAVDLATWSESMTVAPDLRPREAFCAGRAKHRETRRAHDWRHRRDQAWVPAMVSRSAR